MILSYQCFRGDVNVHLGTSSPVLIIDACRSAGRRCSGPTCVASAAVLATSQQYTFHVHGLVRTTAPMAYAIYCIRFPSHLVKMWIYGRMFNQSVCRIGTIISVRPLYITLCCPGLIVESSTSSMLSNPPLSNFETLHRPWNFACDT